MKIILFTALLFLTIFTIQTATAAHWIAGYVQDALDGTSPNGRTVRLWNPLTSEETFGTVGPLGLSGTSNVYMIDCEMLSSSCSVGDKLNITLTDDATGHVAKNIVQVTVSSSGFDLAGNLSINSPITLINLTVEDLFSNPENEIDLTPASTTQISCYGILEDYDGATSISTVTSAFYSTSSTFIAADDNNDHYTNSSCEVNSSYGTPTQALINCTFQIEYYTNPGSWNCTINATDNYTASTIKNDQTSINTLLSLGVDDSINFGYINALQVSNESTVQVINYGNVMIDLSLSGYGATSGDNKSMVCDTGSISIESTKFNLTDSNLGNMELAEVETKYKNLTSSPEVQEFNLNSRQDDFTNDAIKNTYWRIFVPTGSSNACSGNIIFGATQS